MTDNNELNSMNEAMGQIESSMKPIRSGEVVKGKVISVTDKDAMVNIGYMADGILPKNEIAPEDDVDLKSMLKTDDEIDVYIVKTNDGDGNVLLSKIKADRIVAWRELKNLYNNGEVFDVVPKEVVKGGVVAYIKGIRAFIPASQLSINYVKDLNKFVGENLRVKVIELDKDKGKLVLSRREVEQVEADAKREELWSSIKAGEKRTGTVSRLAKFGAFVDLGGIDGLIHISELSWKRVKNPSEVVSVGDKVEVYVLEVDKENNRLSLALKNVDEDPWNNVNEKLKIGDVVEGTVNKFINVGAFVEVETGLEGLVHISEISEERVVRPSDVLNIGDKVRVKILDIDVEGKRISLSIKEAVEKPKENYDKYLDKDDSGLSLGDLFKDKFKNMKFD